MILTRKSIPRRAFLKGVGAAVGLPLLDAMIPAAAKAAQTSSLTKPPLRMAFAYVPNGIDMRYWNPNYEGLLEELPRTLKPLEPFKQDITLLGNLTHNTGRALLDGAGDHGRCSGSYLTGVQVKKTVVDIKASVSCDQLVANEIGGQTRLPSLEVGLEDARQAGDCDSGYSCAYTNNLAWRNATQPLPPILDPRTLFDRLFGEDAALSAEARAEKNRYRRSILDFITEDTQALQRNLGATDRRKLEEYLGSIRDIERQIEKAENDNAVIDPRMEKPYGIPQDFAEHFKLMTDMITVAFQADLTRVVTFLVTREGTSRAYREIGISDGHHPLTHHRNQIELMDKVAEINLYHVQQFAKWLEALKSSKEQSGSILDNSMIVYGAGLADGNSHTHHDLPTLIAGRGGNAIKPGRCIVYRKETPMCNLFLTMMDTMGCHHEQFGDSTGRVGRLDV
jgi:hypothetical protein